MMNLTGRQNNYTKRKNRILVLVIIHTLSIRYQARKERANEKELYGWDGKDGIKSVKT
jgi:hypothetical protein